MLACHILSNVHNNYVVMYQGGEMARNPAIVSLFDKYDYAVRRNAPDTSQNKIPDERPHRYTGELVMSLI